ncbi:MAG: hypothetical protein IPM67_10715 [Sphingomonadales bacterium]|jgi:hypothetical protein|nr:hypothetical protein [Sphingomonadales bacterium]MBK9269094.1 hypothetical protein [Sphingomonadales bacterium]
MTDFLASHLSEIVSAVLGFIGGALVSIPITVRITKGNMSGSSSSANMSGVKAGGDVVGRDKISG